MKLPACRAQFLGHGVAYAVVGAYKERLHGAVVVDELEAAVGDEAIGIKGWGRRCQRLRKLHRREKDKCLHSECAGKLIINPTWQPSWFDCHVAGRNFVLCSKWKQG